LCLKRSWSDFDPQAKIAKQALTKGLQAAVDGWCKIQVLTMLIHDFAAQARQDGAGDRFARSDTAVYISEHSG